MFEFTNNSYIYLRHILPSIGFQWPLFFVVGVNEIDQIVTVLLSTSMAVGCIVPLILDNTIPGTIEERGLTGWGENRVSDEPVVEKYEVAPIEVYNLPFGLHRLSKFKFAKYMPFLPYPYDNGQHQENTLRPTLCC